MKVYKFGGASIKDAPSVKNLLKIIQKISPHQGLCIVVSAMGKTTNALETLLNHYWNQQKNENSLMQIYTFHQKIIEDLFPDEKENIYSLWEADFKVYDQFIRNIDVQKTIYLGASKCLRGEACSLIPHSKPHFRPW